MVDIPLNVVDSHLIPTKKDNKKYNLSIPKQNSIESLIHDERIIQKSDKGDDTVIIDTRFTK